MTYTVLYNYNNQSFDGDEGLTKEQVIERVQMALDDRYNASDTILEWVELKFTDREE